MKLVSIIITTHRGSGYIQRAVESVLNQVYKNIEVIVVDDNGLNSEEQIKTRNKIEQYCSDKRFKYIAHEVNINGAAARNTGFKVSTGEYISFLDDDDIYLSTKISSQVKVLDSLDDGWGMVYCSVAIKNQNGSTMIRKAEKSGHLLYDLLLHRVVIGTNSMLIRRKVYEELNGFDESFLRHQDYEFTARVSANYKIKAIEDIGFEYYREISRNNPQSIEIAQKYRSHYIDKMLPLIRSFDKRKQQIIICSNSLEVTSSYLKRGEIKKFYKVFNNFTSRWLKKISFSVILSVVSMKAYHLFKRKFGVL